MKNKKLAARLSQEVLDFIETRKTLQLASLTEEGAPFASYAPFAIGENCLYVLLSALAVHAVYLKAYPKASVLINEDVKFENIYKSAYKADKNLIKNISLFDVFIGKNIPKGINIEGAKIKYLNFNPFTLSY